MSRRPPLPSLNSSVPKGMANSQGAAASSGPPSRRQQQSLNAILPSLQRSNAASAALPPPSSSGPPSIQQQSLNSLSASLQRSNADQAPPRQEQSSSALSTSLLTTQPSAPSGAGVRGRPPLSAATPAPPSTNLEDEPIQQQVARVQMGAEALALMAEEAWRQEQDKKKASSAAPASAALVSAPPPFRQLSAAPASAALVSAPPPFSPAPQSFPVASSSPSMMEPSGARTTSMSPAILFSSPPPSSADQSVSDKIRSLEKELEECYKKVELRQSLLKNRGSKNVAQQEQIRVLEQQLQQARQAQQDQIKVLEQQLQQARQAQQALDDDATSSSASFGSATSQLSDNESHIDDTGGKRKTKFKKNKKMYNKTSKKYNKTSKKYKNKKARY